VSGLFLALRWHEDEDAHDVDRQAGCDAVIAGAAGGFADTAMVIEQRLGAFPGKLFEGGLQRWQTVELLLQVVVAQRWWHVAGGFGIEQVAHDVTGKQRIALPFGDSNGDRFLTQQQARTMAVSDSELVAPRRRR
jgi:hypothetical protein